GCVVIGDLNVRQVGSRRSSVGRFVCVRRAVGSPGQRCEQQQARRRDHAKRPPCSAQSPLPVFAPLSLWPERLQKQAQSTRPSRTQALCPPRPIAFESATFASASRASFGT